MAEINALISLCFLKKSDFSQPSYHKIVTRLDYLTPADLERMRDPTRNQMKITPLVDKAWLDTVPG